MSKYTVKDGRIYKGNSQYPLNESKITLAHIDGTKHEHQVIKVLGAIEHEGRFFLLDRENRTDWNYYEITATKLDAISVPAIVTNGGNYNHVVKGSVVQGDVYGK